jgi:hypothetical protein
VGPSIELKASEQLPAEAEDTEMAKNERTSKSVASKASKILRDPKSTKAEKSVAGSALTQARDKKRKK